MNEENYSPLAFEIYTTIGGIGLKTGVCVESLKEVPWCWF
jgi:hypothetical protein